MEKLSLWPKYLTKVIAMVEIQLREWSLWQEKVGTTRVVRGEIPRKCGHGLLNSSMSHLSRVHVQSQSTRTQTMIRRNFFLQCFSYVNSGMLANRAARSCNLQGFTQPLFATNRISNSTINVNAATIILRH